MNKVYARDLDLNLLRVFVAVVDAGSVTGAAARLYVTQPAISAALRRLRTAIGAPIFARHGRGVALTERGLQLLEDVRPHLEGLIEAAVAPSHFDLRTSQRTVRLGLADAADEWLVPPLLRLLDREAPCMSLICVPVQFRTIGEALASRRVDLAATVADELPRSIRRRPLFRGGYVCLFDSALQPPRLAPHRARVPGAGPRHRLLQRGPARGGRGRLRTPAPRALLAVHLFRSRRRRRRKRAGGHGAGDLRPPRPAATAAPQECRGAVSVPEGRHGSPLAGGARGRSGVPLRPRRRRHHRRRAGPGRSAALAPRDARVGWARPPGGSHAAAQSVSSSCTTAGAGGSLAMQTQPRVIDTDPRHPTQSIHPGRFARRLSESPILASTWSTLVRRSP